jgi:hypothetical protein
MSLPTLQKSYTFSPCNRITFVSATQCYQDEFVAFKNFLKTCGFTVKGSSDGTTAAMDGSDRIVTPATHWNTRGATTTSAQSWIVIEHTGMAGAEVLFCYQGGSVNTLKVAISPGGLWTVAGTATFQPTATDELIIMAAGTNLDGGAASLDRLWSGWCATDGSEFDFAIARNGVWVRWLRIGMLDPVAIIAPAAWAVPIQGFSISAMAYANLFTTASVSARVDPGTGTYGTRTFYVGCEGYNNGTVPAKVTGAGKLQGAAGKLLTPLSLWDSADEGKLGNMIDIWAGVAANPDGTTYPNDSSRQFIHVGNFVLPWNGSVVAMS